MALIQLLIIFLIVILLLLQKLDVRICISQQIDITISSVFFSLVILDVSSKRSKKKFAPGKCLGRIAFYTKALKMLINRSDVTVYSYRPFTPSSLCSAERLIFISIAAPLLLLLLKANALEYSEGDESSHDIDISFTFSLSALFISLAKASYYYLKLKIKRGMKNAG